MRVTTLLAKNRTFGVVMSAICAATLAIPSLPASAETAMGTPSTDVRPRARAEAIGRLGIVSCTVIAGITNVPQTNDGTPTSDPLALTLGIDIVFVNRAASPADSVTFLVTYGGRSISEQDKGRFSPGVTIDRVFAAFAGDPYNGETPERCYVTAIHFEDGTLWSA